jgi:hypothetical protein
LRRSIDDNGDLLIQRVANSEVERMPILPQLKTPSWFDPETKVPRA